jgi:hypothetical protein
MKLFLVFLHVIGFILEKQGEDAWIVHEVERPDVVDGIP